MTQDFPKPEKLKSRKLIGQLFAEGKSISRFPLRLVYMPVVLPPGIRFQVGVSASKRNFRKAVSRNRIKRLLREAYRLNKHILEEGHKGGYAFMLLYQHREMPDFEQVNRKMQQLLHLFLEKEAAAAGVKNTTDDV
ncbi:ribonuclease P protein component [Sinomicrobium soli]|uniref:ribonuclease P protein component n=1 Tax=Sinomicrobium sp. N-1-3-6 TaxID=2219864 RepID=UPI000DCCD565|nr:ribonuclease P protein component [Sinomicrobium sp. N-1-3-6]RAV28304.1 ribonuclease P protein component [Sinomicrobium sp. N-1-3-6]